MVEVVHSEGEDVVQRLEADGVLLAREDGLVVAEGDRMATVLQLGVVYHFYLVLPEYAHDFKILLESFMVWIVEVRVGGLFVDTGTNFNGSFPNNIVVFCKQEGFLVAIDVQISNQQD